MLPRVLTAVIGLPIVLGAVWAGDPIFTVFGLIVALLALREFFGLARGAGGRPFDLLGYALGALLFRMTSQLGPEALPPLLTVALVLCLSGAMLRWRERQQDTGWLWTLAGLLYVPLLLVHFVWLRALPQGVEWVVLALLVTFATDTAAYAAGSAVGRHKLAPRLSPGKTREGAVGGLAGAVMAAVVLMWGFGLPGGVGAAAGLGLVVGVMSQVGDLAESYLKRTAGAKDSGGLIPGHGGLLDRLDSLVFAGPFVYYYAIWVLGAG